MAYDYRTRANPPYGSRTSMYGPPSSSSTAPHVSSSLYPNITQSGTPPAFPATGGRAPPYHQTSAPSHSSGTGIRVAIKPEYRITPPPQLSPQVGEIPHSNFHFDFELERKILAEAEKESQNWGRFGLENLPSRTTESASSATPAADPVVSKYVASGLNREAVHLAVANYGDNPTKVREFVKGYTLLREMGFDSNSVAEALLMFDNDSDKALAHFLNNPA